MKKIFLNLILFCILTANFTYAKLYTDLAGRKVEIKGPVKRVMLMEARTIYIFSALNKQDPFKNIVAMGSDLRIYDHDAYLKYQKAFPKSLKKVKEIGDPYKANYNVEYLLSLKPDLLIFSLHHYQNVLESKIIEKFEKLNIPSIFIDFRMKAIKNTVPSIKLLGELMAAKKSARKFSRIYKKYMNLVQKRVKKLKKTRKPSVFIEIGAGIFLGEKELKTFGRSNIGMFIEKAGGVHIGSKLNTGFTTSVSPEFLAKNNPDIIMITDCKDDRKEGKALILGYNGKSLREIQKVLRKLVDESSIHKYLKAFHKKQVYAIYQQFYNSPYHFILILQMAKWFYPNHFKDVNPLKIFKHLHKNYLAIPYSGNFWAALK